MSEIKDNLVQLFKMFTGVDYDYHNFEHREAFHSLVYALEAHQLPGLNYKFILRNGVPYSLELEKESVGDLSKKIRYSRDTTKSIKALKKVLDKDGGTVKGMKRMGAVFFLGNEYGWGKDRTLKHLEKYGLLPNVLPEEKEVKFTSKPLDAISDNILQIKTNTPNSTKSDTDIDMDVFKKVEKLEINTEPLNSVKPEVKHENV